MTTLRLPAIRWAIAALVAGTLAVLAGCWTYGIALSPVAMPLMSSALLLLVVAAAAGLWWDRPWALWTILVAVSFAATLDLFLWSLDANPVLVVSSAIALSGAAVLAFRVGPPLGRNVSPYQRILFGFVMFFAGWVAVWGLFLPAKIGQALPLAVAPLHARFLGAMYLSGAVFMLLGMQARRWHEIRVVTLMLGLWTGTLGLVSVINLGAFDWSRGPTWFWFVAYICYPLVALWVAWCQRGETQGPEGPALSQWFVAYLHLQGSVCIALAVALLVTPQLVAPVWPWKVPVLLAQIYGAPFLSYGLGSLYAARQKRWSAVRIPLLGTLVFTAGALIASLLHLKLFNAHTISAWTWFLGFGLASIAMVLPILHRAGHRI